MQYDSLQQGLLVRESSRLSSSRLVAAIAAVILLGAAPSRALTTMTMDDLPTQAIDGLSHLGVNFGFTLDGSPSTDSRYNNPTGPGLTTYTTDPSIEGNTDGVIQLDFDNPTTVLEIGFALAVTTPETGSVLIELFDPALSSLGTFELDITPGAFAFSSGQFQNLGGACVSRAIISFDSFGDRFVMDNLTYEESIPCGCPIAPTSCLTSLSGKGLFLVKETKAGKEKLIAKILKGPALTQTDLGNPVSGSTAYDMCVYDYLGELVANLRVDRAGDLCSSGKDCWKSIGGNPPDGKGFSYKDSATTSSGVLKILAKAGSEGRSKVLFKAKNASGNMPTGIAASLNGSTSVTLQAHVSDGECVSTTLFNVLKDDGDFYKIK